MIVRPILIHVEALAIADKVIACRNGSITEAGGYTIKFGTVSDADGRLIGLNFDRVWEGTMSDEVYDPEICRNISIDIRYALFVIDRIGGASYLFDEMVLVP